MTYVTQIGLENYGRFRGEHALALGPNVYGVVAQTVADERRSNWQGKSTLLNAVAHALFGWHDFPSEDGWISYDEGRGRLVVKTSDGWSYARERVRGKSTPLVVDGPKGRLAGDAAQIEIGRIVGLDEQDFFATCFFRQKSMSRFVLMDPSERMRVVNGWLGLERGERCVSNARLRLAKAVERLRKITDRVAFQQQLVDRAKPIAELEADVVSAYEVWQKAKAEEANAYRYERAERFAELNQAGERERAKYDAHLAEKSGGRHALVAEAAKAEEAEGEVRGALAAAEVAARGEFGGECPVSGRACPVAAEINAGSAEARARCQALEPKFAKLSSARRQVTIELTKWRSVRRSRLLSYWRLESLKLRALEVLPDHRWALANPPKELPHEQTALAEHAQAIRNLDAAKDAAAELERLKAERAEAERAVELARSASKAYAAGQRLVAEQGLKKIEDGANALLAEAGVELAVKMQWAREGKELAAQCAECGFPFPKSQKVKACERCAAARGPKLIEKMLVELSDRSGAAEDLGGMATMLSASAWLRDRRGAAWGSAFLDEPVGACDGHNRRAVVGYVAGLLRGRLGFEQAFLVAHTRDALDALPARVTIVGDGKWSRFEGV